MKTFSRVLAHGSVALALVLLASGCGSNSGLVNSDAGGAPGTTTGGAGADGGVNDTIPAGWAGAGPFMIQQSRCIGDGSAAATLAVSEMSGGIEATLESVEFREFQSLCGHVVDSGGTTRVLIQPCDLHPTGVSKGDCAYDVTFTLPARADRTAVDVYRRFDFYGAKTPPLPVLLATAHLGAADGGGSSTDGGVD